MRYLLLQTNVTYITYKTNKARVVAFKNDKGYPQVITEPLE